MGDFEIEKIDSMKRIVKVLVPSDEIKEKMDEQYDYLKKNVKVPGFRKGKAPRMILRRYYGDNVKEVTKEGIYKDYLEELFADKDNLILTLPEIVYDEFKTDNSFEFRVVYFEPPDMEIKPYEAYGDRIEILSSEILIEERKNEFLNQHAELAPKEGTAEEGDYIFGSYELYNESDDLIEEEENFQLELGSEDVFLQELNNQLIGVSSGDTIDFQTTIPEDDTESGLGGKTVKFKIVVDDIKEKELPELDEEFLQKELDIEKEIFETEIEDQVLSKLEGEINNKKEEIILEHIEEDYDFEISEEYFEKYYQYRQRILRVILERCDEEELENFDEQTRKRVFYQQVLRKMAHEKDIDYGTEDIKRFVYNFSSYSGMDMNEFVETFVRDPEQGKYVASDIIMENMMNFLIDDIKFTIVEVDRDGKPLRSELLDFVSQKIETDEVETEEEEEIQEVTAEQDDEKVSQTESEENIEETNQEEISESSKEKSEEE